MAAPKVTKTANFIAFDGDQSFTVVFPEFGVKRAKFTGINWFLDPEYKYPLTVFDTAEFPEFYGYPQIFYAKASGTGPLSGAIILLETSPHFNNSYVDDYKVSTMVVAL